ncbi:MAG: hypothetical protein GY770_09865 [Aestuariibacter sp.]|nr:hypothetical protein [Aestuariibacter sp.]
MGEHHSIAYNGLLYFVADDGQGRELWTSDGSSVGTVLLKDLDAGAGSNNPSEFRIVVGRLVFFSSEGGAATDGLWVTDGSIPGTVRAKIEGQAIQFIFPVPHTHSASPPGSPSHN